MTTIKKTKTDSKKEKTETAETKKTKPVAKKAVKKTTVKSEKKAIKPAVKSAIKTEAVKDSPKPKKSKAKEEVSSKIRIRVRAYEHKILDSSVKQIIDTVLRYDANIVGPIPLPTEIKKYTVNRASFVYKDAREQFEMRIHKRLIDVLNPTPKIVEALTNLNLPSGINIDIKMI